KHAVMDVGEHTPELRVRRKRANRRLAHDVSDHGHPAPPAEMGERPDGQLLQQDHARIVGARKPNRIAEERVSLGWNCVAVEDVPCSDNQAHYSTSVRIVVADPSAFTPAYDHELASALAEAGAEVELVTSRFRFGEARAPGGYRRSEPFYPISSRAFQRSRLR